MEATSVSDYLVLFPNGNKESIKPDEAELSQRSYVSNFSDPSANGDENLVTINTIKLGHAVNTDVKEIDYLVVSTTGDEEWVTTNVIKLGGANDYLVPVAIGDKDLVTTDVLELGHASGYLGVLATRDNELVEPNAVNISHTDYAQYMHISPVSTQFSTTTDENCYSELSTAKLERKCNLACFKVLFLN